MRQLLRLTKHWDTACFPWSPLASKLLPTFAAAHIEFRPLQLAAINLAQSGYSLFLNWPTGAGKSLCFQLPALLQDAKNSPTHRITLVISPLKSLVHDQIQHLERMQLAHAVKRLASQDIPQLHHLDGVSLLYATPEILLQNQDAAQLIMQLYECNRLERLVVDEAHCVLEWGNTFRPAYMKLAQLRARKMGNIPVTLLTATASEHAIQMLAQSFGVEQIALPEPKHLGNNDEEQQKRANAHELVVLRQISDRANLKLKILPKHEVVVQNMLGIVKIIRNEPAIVYTLTKNEAEEVAKGLSKVGCRVQAYHAGMSDAARKRVQQQWMSGKISTICATVAFGVRYTFY